MHNTHSRNTVRYYILAVVFLAFLFFSNDFGLMDVQKTAIVMAVGVDKEEDEFVLTSQIAMPQAGQQKSSQAVQLVSKGKTVAEAFEQINAKTGWYPKLVFCELILLGEKTAQENVFDALDFFLLDEYLADDCQVAVCKGLARDILNTSALVDPSSGVAISKILSPHAERVGSVHPVNLKDFSIGHFGDSRSAMLPILKTEPQQEKINSSSTPSNSSSAESGGQGEQGGQNGKQNSSQSSGQGGQGSGEEKNKPVFSARETALFVYGKWRETLNEEETFAVNIALGKLRLASYSVDYLDNTCTLVIKRNDPKIRLKLGEDGKGQVKITLSVTAGLADYSKALGVDELADVGDVPDGVFGAAEKKLSAALHTVYEKARRVGCDVFGLQERLIKYKQRKYHQYKDVLLDNVSLVTDVRFRNVR